MGGGGGGVYLILLLSNIAGVVSIVERATVIDYCKE